MKIKLTIKLVDFVIAQFAIVTAILILGISSYIFAHITGHDYLLGFLRLLNVGSELSLPTYFSILNLLLSSIFLFIIYRYEKENKNKGFNYWLFLSILFLLLSADESSAIHENFANVYIYLAQKGIIDPLLQTHQWLPFGILFILIVWGLLLPFFKLLPKDTLFYFLISGLVFIIGAVVFEFIGLLMLKTGFVQSRSSLAYLIRRILEEGCEMYGIAMFNCALYREITNRKISLIIGD